MAEQTFNFKLARQAKSQGGGRYEVAVKGEAKPWAVYVPQSVCRPDGTTPAEKLSIIIKAS